MLRVTKYDLMPTYRLPLTNALEINMMTRVAIYLCVACLIYLFFPKNSNCLAYERKMLALGEGLSQLYSYPLKDHILRFTYTCKIKILKKPTLKQL